MARCTARSKQSGQQCKRPAAAGQEVCASHGAKAPQAKAAAQRRLDEQHALDSLRRGLAAAYGDAVPAIDPAEAMLQAVSWKYAEVVALRQKVAELDDHDRVWGVTKEKSGGDDHGTTQEAKPNIWWSMLRTAEDALVKYAAAARAAGCDERRVRLAEQQGSLVALAVRRILDALDLTPDQQTLVGEVVPRELRALGGEQP